MELTVLGCSGSGPGPTSPASGYLVRAGGQAVVLDLGNGTLGALQRHLDPFDLDALVLSHLHPDHCADVPALVIYRRYHPRPPGRPKPIRLLAPSEAPSQLAAAYAPSAEERDRTDLGDVLAFRQLGGPAALGELRLTAAPVEHPCEAYAVRLAHGAASLVYSGDTGPCDALVELAAGADMLLCEASWPHRDDAPRGVHLSGRQAGEVAGAAGVGRLLLTHVPAWFDGRQLLAEAQAAFAGPVDLVAPGMRYPV